MHQMGLQMSHRIVRAKDRLQRSDCLGYREFLEHDGANDRHRATLYKHILLMAERTGSSHVRLFEIVASCQSKRCRLREF